MGTRPLRHFYGDDAHLLVADDSLGDVVEPWLRHRARLLGALESLTDAQWQAPSRCEGWSNRDVVAHLVDVDAFWTFSVTKGRAGTPPAVLRDFDPTDTPRALVDAMAARSTDAVLAAFVQNANVLRETVSSLRDDEWGVICESPVGHVDARLLLAHALWDSWLHERDILVPLGLAPPSEGDEVAVVTWYTLFIAASQGGLVGDPSAVGDGPSTAFATEVRFTDLAPLEVEVADRVCVARADDGIAAGDPVRFVEAHTGRVAATVEIEPALDAHLARARQIF